MPGDRRTFIQNTGMTESQFAGLQLLKVFSYRTANSAERVTHTFSSRPLRMGGSRRARASVMGACVSPVTVTCLRRDDGKIRVWGVEHFPQAFKRPSIALDADLSGQHGARH